MLYFKSESEEKYSNAFYFMIPLEGSEKSHDTKQMGIWHLERSIWFRKNRKIFYTAIESFLEGCAMQVCSGSTPFDCFEQEQGIPQGSIFPTSLSIFIKYYNKLYRQLSR